MLTVFLSSTSKDLEKCRDAAYHAIEGLHGYHCVRMEDFGSWDEAPDDFCRAKVAESDVFICLAGPLYGSVAPAGISYTEREFQAAVDHSKPCLVFMTAEDFPLPANLIESDESRQRQLVFRKTVATGRIVTRFSSPNEVSIKVVQAIRNWEASRAAGLPTQASLLASQINSVSYRVAVLNESKTVSDDEVRAAVVALQKQVHDDFAPAWGVDAELTFVPRDSKPQAGSWWLALADNSDYEGAVAYHSITAEGLPYVKISAASARQQDWPWSMAASHDLLEMLANPRLNLTVVVSEDNAQTGRIYIREICDPVASPNCAYKIGGIVVSDFVYPAWFESFRVPGNTQFDHASHVSAPFEVAADSYVTYCDFKTSFGWQSAVGQQPPYKTNPVKRKVAVRKRIRKRN
jgi:uncharacterized protein DUF4062